MSEHVHVPDYFRNFICQYFHDLGERWIDNISDIVMKYAELWELIPQAPFPKLTFNFVMPVTQCNGTHAVLKVGVPEPEQLAEIHALAAFDGRGMVRMLKHNTVDHVTLIERLNPGSSLSELFPDQDDTATAIAAKLITRLPTPPPADKSMFPTVEGWATRGMTALRNEFDGGTGPFPTGLVERAESLFRDLIGSTNEEWLLHGDLHHTNILSSNDHREWVAIDPKGVIGDRAFDTAAFILNPNSDIHSTPNLNDILARRIDHISEVTGIDRQRIHGWALAFSILSAWWDYGDSDNWRKTLDLGARLNKIR